MSLKNTKKPNTKFIILCLAIAAVVAAGDQVFKQWIVNTVALNDTVSFLPGIVSLSHIRNTGASFSMFEDARVFLSAISVLGSVAILTVITLGKVSTWESLVLAAVLGGAIGNLIDRVVLGYVVDMFKLEFMNFAIFNVADCFIVCGGIAFCILYYIRTEKEEKAAKAAKAEAEASEEGDEA